jgi:hypothetical protein
MRDLMLSILSNLKINFIIIFLILKGLNIHIKEINAKHIKKRVSTIRYEFTNIYKKIYDIIKKKDQNFNDLDNTIEPSFDQIINGTDNSDIIDTFYGIRDSVNTSINTSLENNFPDTNALDHINITKHWNTLKEFFDVGRITNITFNCDVVKLIYDMILADIYLHETSKKLADTVKNNEIRNELIIYNKQMGELQLLLLLKSLSKIFKPTDNNDNIEIDLLPFIRAINNKTKSLVNMQMAQLSNEIDNIPPIATNNKYKLLNNKYNFENNKDLYMVKYIKYKNKYLKLKNN